MWPEEEINAQELTLEELQHLRGQNYYLMQQISKIKQKHLQYRSQPVKKGKVFTGGHARAVIPEVNTNFFVYFGVCTFA